MKQLFGRNLIFEKVAITSKIEARIPLEVREINSSELNILKSVRNLNQNKIEQFKRRFDRNDRCFVAFSKECPCHYSWLRTSGIMYIQDVRKYIKLNLGEHWVYDCRTNENFRGKNIYPNVISGISNDLLHLGDINSVKIDVNPKNISSRKGIEKAGFKLIQKTFSFYKFSFSQSVKK